MIPLTPDQLQSVRNDLLEGRTVFLGRGYLPQVRLYLLAQQVPVTVTVTGTGARLRAA